MCPWSASRVAVGDPHLLKSYTTSPPECGLDLETDSVSTMQKGRGLF